MRNVEKEIEEKLKEIEQKEQVRILYAVESGSRAWGFASPDSDYDVRFIYVRPLEAYLRLEGVRDVIEWQLDEVLDINGWDLKKALIQFQRGNAALFEWAVSPIVYRTSEEWKRIYDTAKNYFSVKTAVHQYLGTAKSTYMQYLQDDMVRYKKYFYAIRPLLAARYIEENRCPAPILFGDLMGQEMPDQLRSAIECVQKVKMASDEKDLNPQNIEIQRFIEEEIGRQKEIAESLPKDRNDDWKTLNQVFLEALGAKI